MSCVDVSNDMTPCIDYIYIVRREDRSYLFRDVTSQQVSWNSTSRPKFHLSYIRCKSNPKLTNKHEFSTSKRMRTSHAAMKKTTDKREENNPKWNRNDNTLLITAYILYRMSTNYLQGCLYGKARRDEGRNQQCIYGYKSKYKMLVHVLPI